MTDRCEREALEMTDHSLTLRDETIISASRDGRTRSAERAFGLKMEVIDFREDHIHIAVAARTRAMEELAGPGALSGLLHKALMQHSMPG